MTLRVAFIGAPGSGKSVMAAQLYAALLKRGVSSVEIVMEEASKYIRINRDIPSWKVQKEIAIQQNLNMHDTNADIQICESPCWVADVYGAMRFPAEYTETFLTKGPRIDLSIFVPLWKDEHITGTHRLSNMMYTPKQLENELFKTLRTLPYMRRGEIMVVPRDLNLRETASLDNIIKLILIEREVVDMSIPEFDISAIDR